MRALLRDPAFPAVIREAIVASLGRCRQPHGFAGIPASGVSAHAPVQPASLLGDWLKVGALLDPLLPPNAVFNERGHIIQRRT
jgi:hypothetical protein